NKRNGKNDKLLGYTENNYARGVDNRKSISRCLIFGWRCSLWASKKQPVVTLSTTEAKFVVASFCLTQCATGWASSVKCGTKIMCDNSSTIKLSKNYVLHGRIDACFHFLRDLAKEKVIGLEHCGTQDQVADIMTKALELDTFPHVRAKLGV
ncbi:hypothetical protein V2J09_010758, partial [Rumex salicifolius]